MNEDKMNDLKEKWEAMKREYAAGQDKIAAEKRMEANDAFENFGKEVDAGGDWVEANWEEFTARADKWWQSLEIAGHNAAESMGINTD